MHKHKLGENREKGHIRYHLFFIMSFVICFMLLFVGTGIASATTYYVAQGGSDSNKGLSLDHAWATPSYAAQQAQAGDTIYLVDGTWYGEHVVFANSGTEGNPIMMTAYNGTPTLDGMDSIEKGIEIIGREWIKISDIKAIKYTAIAIGAKSSAHITFENDIAGLSHDGISLHTGSHDCTIRKCTAYDNQMHNIRTSTSHDIIIEDCNSYYYGQEHPDYGYAILDCYNLNINNCKAIGTTNNQFNHGLTFMDTCHDCVVENLTVEYAWEGMGAREGAYDLTFRNCSILHNDEAWSEGYFFRTNVSNITIENCIATGYYTGFSFKNTASNVNLSGGVAYNCYRGIQMSSPSTKVKNSIAIGAHDGVIGANGIITYSNIWDNINNYGYGASPGIGCISEDPLFADPGNGDFHLKSTGGRWTKSGWVYTDTKVSPSIDAGDPADGYSNEPELNGGRVNMGAYGNTVEASRSPSIDTHNISGYVKYENGTGIYNAHVVNDPRSAEDYTDENGYYVLMDLTNGIYNVTASKAGFYDNSTIKTIAGADVENANITLMPVTPDTTSPIIININATNITDKSATIVWETDEISDSIVKYGTNSGDYPHEKNDSTDVVFHSINLTGLDAKTTYYYIVNSTGPSVNSNESVEYSFTTKKDLTTPTTNATITPAPNEAGWNNVIPVVVTFFRNDNGGSGVSYTHYSKTSETGPWTTVNIATAMGPDAENVTDIGEDKFNVTVSDEGVTTIWYYTVNNNATSEPIKNVTVKIDTTPPASISDLKNTTGTTWINWTWTNPTDSDFNYTMVYLDGIFKTNTSNSYYNATGLIADTSYEIGTHRVDINGNVNTTWVNQTAKTVNNLIPRYDVNEDGTVDILDTTIVGQHFGETTSSPYPRYDVNEDGTVDILDTTIVGQHFGEIMR